MTGYSTLQLKEFPKVIGGRDDENGLLAYRDVNIAHKGLRYLESQRFDLPFDPLHLKFEYPTRRK